MEQQPPRMFTVFPNLPQDFAYLIWKTALTQHFGSSEPICHLHMEYAERGDLQPLRIHRDDFATAKGSCPIQYVNHDARTAFLAAMGSISPIYFIRAEGDIEYALVWGTSEEVSRGADGMVTTHIRPPANERFVTITPEFRLHPTSTIMIPASEAWHDGFFLKGLQRILSTEITRILVKIAGSDGAYQPYHLRLSTNPQEQIKIVGHTDCYIISTEGVAQDSFPHKGLRKHSVAIAGWSVIPGPKGQSAWDVLLPVDDTAGKFDEFKVLRREMALVELARKERKKDFTYAWLDENCALFFSDQANKEMNTQIGEWEEWLPALESISFLAWKRPLLPSGIEAVKEARQKSLSGSIPSIKEPFVYIYMASAPD